MINYEQNNQASDLADTDKEKRSRRRELQLPLVDNIKNLLQAHIELPRIIIKSVSETFRIIRHAKARPLAPEERIELFRRLYPVVAQIYEQLQFGQLDIELANHDKVWTIDVKLTNPSWLKLERHQPDSLPGEEEADFLQDGEILSFDLYNPEEIQKALVALQEVRFKRKNHPSKG